MLCLTSLLRCLDPWLYKPLSSLVWGHFSSQGLQVVTFWLNHSPAASVTQSSTCKTLDLCRPTVTDTMTIWCWCWWYFHISLSTSCSSIQVGSYISLNCETCCMVPPLSPRANLRQSQPRPSGCCTLYTQRQTYIAITNDHSHAHDYDHGQSLNY